MEQIKIDNFTKEHSGISFPNYTDLGNKNCADISFSLSKKLKLDLPADSLMLVNEVDRLGEVCDGVSCNDNNFDLKSVLFYLGVNCLEYVYINWYRYDDIDRMKFIDLAKYFGDIWYPGVDDIDIFDESLTWILSITHFGQVKLLKISTQVPRGRPT